MFPPLCSSSTFVWIVTLLRSASALGLPPLYTNASTIHTISSETSSNSHESLQATSPLTYPDVSTPSSNNVAPVSSLLLSTPAGPASTSLTNHGVASDPIPSQAVLDPPFTYTIPIPPGSGTPNALSVLLPALETFGTPVPTCWPCEWPTTVITGAVSTGVPFTTTFTSLPPQTSLTPTDGSSSDGNPSESPSNTTDEPTTGTTSIGSEETTITSSPTSSSQDSTETNTSSNSQEPTETSSSSPTSFSTSTTTTSSDTSTTESSTSSEESPTSMPSDFIPPAPPAPPSSASRCSERLHWIAATFATLIYFQIS